jgi:hypothetical protein
MAVYGRTEAKLLQIHPLKDDSKHVYCISNKKGRIRFAAPGQEQAEQQQTKAAVENFGQAVESLAGGIGGIFQHTPCSIAGKP